TSLIIGGVPALDFDYQPAIDFQAYFARKSLDSLPALQAIDQNAWAFDERDLTVPEVVKMLDRLPASGLIVDYDRTDGPTLQIAPDHYRRNVAFGKVHQQLRIQIHRIGDCDKAFYAPAQQQIDAMLKL